MFDSFILGSSEGIRLLFVACGIGVTTIVLYLKYKRNVYRTGTDRLRELGIIPVHVPGYINGIIDMRVEIAWARLSAKGRKKTGHALAHAISIRLVDELKDLSNAELEQEYSNAKRDYKLLTQPY